MVDESGRNLGIMPLERALALAQERGLDLVEVAPDHNPVVCKIVDYGKYLYQIEKREKKQKRPSKLKEVKFTIQTGEHDFQTKLERIREFLEEGSKVRVTVFFKGRQIIHLRKGQELLSRVAEELKEIAKVDQDPLAKGRTLQMLLSPLRTKGGSS